MPKPRTAHCFVHGLTGWWAQERSRRELAERIKTDEVLRQERIKVHQKFAADIDAQERVINAKLLEDLVRMCVCVCRLIFISETSKWNLDQNNKFSMLGVRARMMTKTKAASRTDPGIFF